MHMLHSSVVGSKTLTPPRPPSPPGLGHTVTGAAPNDAAPQGRRHEGQDPRSRARAVFAKRGYEAARQMRAIARAAGVALGTRTYYSAPKSTSSRRSTDRTHLEHVAASRTAARGAERISKPRLLPGHRARKLETIEPYHRFAGLLFRSAADPASPLNPFSAESQPALRHEATEIFRKVVEGSRGRIAPELAPSCRSLLWLYHMGIVLFWIHDMSKGTAAHLAADGTVGRFDREAGAARVAALMGPVRRAALRLGAELRNGA